MFRRLPLAKPRGGKLPVGALTGSARRFYMPARGRSAGRRDPPFRRHQASIPEAAPDGEQGQPRSRIGRSGGTGPAGRGATAMMRADWRDEEMKDETDLPAEQARPQAAPRFPRPDGDQERPQDHQPPSGARAQAPLGLTRAGAAAASALPVETLRRRSDFLAAARGRRVARPGFALQAREREGEDPAPGRARVGFTCSRKVGKAVARNRARRRLRALARAVLPRHGRPGWDYVLIGRPVETANLPFALLIRELEAALARVHAAPGRSHDRSRSRAPRSREGQK
jgi:ribonuclease P protein component